MNDLKRPLSKEHDPYTIYLVNERMKPDRFDNGIGKCVLRKVASFSNCSPTAASQKFCTVYMVQYDNPHTVASTIDIVSYIYASTLH